VVMKKKMIISPALLFAFSFALFSLAAINPSTVSASEIARIEEYAGSVSLYEKSLDKTAPVRMKGRSLQFGDRVIVPEGAWARLAYPDGSRVLLKERTELLLEEEKLVSLAKGRAFFRMLFQKMGRFSVRQGNAVIGIKGTTFLVDTSGSKTEVFMKEGRVEVLAVKGQFKRYKRSIMDEFEKYREEGVRALEEESAAFEEYKRQMEKEFIEYVKAFEIEAGRGVSIDGTEVRDVKIPESVMDEFRRFEESLDGAIR